MNDDIPAKPFLEMVMEVRLWDPTNPQHGIMRLLSEFINPTGNKAGDASPRTGYGLVVRPDHFFAGFFGVN